MNKLKDKINNKKKIRKYIIAASILVILLLIGAIKVFASVNEYDFSRKITIDLNGGVSGNMGYESQVDRDGCGYSKGEWVSWLGIGKTVKDKELIDNTITGYDDCESPKEGTFNEHCDFVGITPYVYIQTPSRDYYNLTGWSSNTSYFESDGYYYFEVGCYTADSGNVEMTADWSPWSHTIHYDANGGTGAPSDQIKVYGESMWISVTEPTRPGYVFKGWTCSKGGTYNPGDAYTADYDGETVTMTAEWKLYEHTVHYDANGGLGAPSDQTKKYGVQMSISTSVPTKLGYTFKYWTASIGGKYNSGQEYTHDQDGGTVTMTAYWNDETAPNCTSFYALPNSWSEGEGTVGFTVQDQGTGLASVELNRYSYVTRSWSTVKTWSYDGTTTAQTDTYTETDEGVFYYRLTVKDKAGNIITKNSVAIFLDHSSPVLSGMNTTIADWTNVAPVISVSATDYLTDTTYTGSGIESIVIKDDSEGAVASGIDTVTYTLESRDEGIHLWTIIATDNVGHTNSSQVTTKYDITKPGMDGTEITYVQNGVTYSGYCQDNIIRQHLDDEANRSDNNPNCTSGLKSVILYEVKNEVKKVIRSSNTQFTAGGSNTHENFDMFYDINTIDHTVDYYLIVASDYAGNISQKKLISQRTLLKKMHTSIDRSSYE